MRYLIDTDWLIDTMQGQADTTDTLVQLGDRGLAISVISLGEIYEGIVGRPDGDSHLAAARDLIAGYVLLGLDDQIMEVFARTRYALRRQGMLIPDLDLLIASTAIAHDLTLVTRNLRHFNRVKDLKIYPTSDDIV